MYPISPFLRNPQIETQILKRNSDELRCLMGWLCKTPTLTTYRLNLQRTDFYTFKEHIEQLITAKYGTPAPSIFPIPEIPEVLCIQKLPIDPDEISKSAKELKEVIVDTSCGAAVLRGAHVYAPGVLAMESGTKQGEKVGVYADLFGQCKKGTNTRYMSNGKYLVGIGIVRLQRYQLYGPNITPQGIAIEMLHSHFGVPSLGDLSTADALLQNLPSIVCVRALQPQPGERVLDMCAAPGNKTTHIAEMMRDRGVVWALDKIPKKVTLMEKRLQKAGWQCVHTYAIDASKVCTGKEDSDETLHPPFGVNSFDRVLLDAPCSALGNRPMLAANNMTARMLESYPRVQRKLLESAVQLLKPKGVLVYSTCTVTEDENEGMVAWALEKFPELELVRATPQFGLVGLPNVGLSEEQRQLVQRFGPHEAKWSTHQTGVDDSIGFFIAKFKKRSPHASQS